MVNDNVHCIYKHTTPDGKIYIGQTNDIKVRWTPSSYKTSAPRFYEAIENFGWENITHEILFTNLTQLEADSKERELIASLNTQNEEKGYNISPGGTGGNQKPTTPVKMYSMDGRYIKTFESAADAAREVNTHRNCITTCCLKKAKSASEYRWSYANEELDWSYINNNVRSKNNAKKHPVKITDLETKETKIFESRADAIKYYNFYRGGFMWCLNNKKTSFPKLYLKRYLLEEV